MKKHYLNSLSLVLILLIIFVTNAYSQVSEAVLQSMKSEMVRVKLDKRHGITRGLKKEVYFSGKLTAVEQNTITVIGNKKGNVEEIPKELVLSINSLNHNFLKTKVNRWGAGAIGWFVGFGVGSYIHGDLKGGAVGLIWDLVNVYGLVLFLLWSNNLTSSSPSEFILVNGTYGLFILSTFIFSKIYQAHRPHKWHKKNLSLLEIIYLAPDIAYNEPVGIKGGLTYRLRF